MNLSFKLTTVFCIFATGPTVADNVTTTLTIEPSRCIALQQGQACFANLKFHWTTPNSGEFCLHDDRQTNALVCWDGNTVTSYKIAFKSDKNVNYEIRSKLDDQALAQAMVKVSWVYKSNTSSTSRWRLF